MMRAMPYCSVSPNAISAYIPPSTSPDRTMSSVSVIIKSAPQFLIHLSRGKGPDREAIRIRGKAYRESKSPTPDPSPPLASARVGRGNHQNGS